MLQINDQTPDFSLPASNNETVTLSGINGPVVLFFYPKDDTPGCTNEAKDFTERLGEFEALGVTVFGISPDPVKKHLKFIDKHELGMVLLADEAHEALEAFGVWVEKSMYGRTYMGVERSTFLINKDGKIDTVWRKVKVKNHAQEVLDAAQNMRP